LAKRTKQACPPTGWKSFKNNMPFVLVRSYPTPHQDHQNPSSHTADYFWTPALYKVVRLI